jgi:Eukaryotic glutathione synthase, ATP binding domain.
LCFGASKLSCNVDGFRNSSDVLVNRQVGYILRTKQSNVDEGGVAAGSGALNSPYLID